MSKVREDITIEAPRKTPTDSDPPIDVRLRCARAAFDAFYAEGTPYNAIEQVMFVHVADAVINTLREAGES